MSPVPVGHHEPDANAYVTNDIFLATFQNLGCSRHACKGSIMRPEEEAKKTLAILEELGEVQEELEAMHKSQESLRV